MVLLDDREVIEGFLRGEPWVHLYELGDLDDAVWPSTVWHAVKSEGRIRGVALVYTVPAEPVVLALSGANVEWLRRLIGPVAASLPDGFYAHLSPTVEEGLGDGYEVVSHGLHLKMALTDPACVSRADAAGAVRLAARDAEEALRLYDESYPGHWFRPRELEAKPYFGVRSEGRLVSIAGVHAYSREYRVAALGNVATHPAFRRRGLARAAVAALCGFLSDHVEHIGLNVKADNEAAVGCYAGLGFEYAASYEEHTVRRAGRKDAAGQERVS